MIHFLGPIQCYSCNNPKRLSCDPKVETCKENQVCSAHFSISKSTGKFYFYTSTVHTIIEIIKHSFCVTGAKEEISLGCEDSLAFNISCTYVETGDVYGELCFCATSFCNSDIFIAEPIRRLRYHPNFTPLLITEPLFETPKKGDVSLNVSEKTDVPSTKKSPEKPEKPEPIGHSSVATASVVVLCVHFFVAFVFA